MQSKLEFVTDGSKVYRLAGNDWYAVEEDDGKVMLVDTDCKIDDKALKTPWSNGDCRSEEGENGQCILDYVNKLADTYFSDIKYAIFPRIIDVGTDDLEDAYMWPMSYEEFKDHKDIGGKIVENANCFVWTRTFSGINSNNYRFAWDVDDFDGGLNGDNCVGNVYRVAPAFYLKKSAIDHISDDGKIVLKLADTVQNASSDTEKLLSQVCEYAKAMADVNRFEQKLAYAQGNDVLALKAQEMVDVYERILYLATNITD